MITRFAMLATAATLAACGGSDYKVEPSAFEKELVADYKPLAEYEAVQGDVADARFYRKRVNAIMAGDTPVPTVLATREIPADKVAELAEAREKLVVYLNSGAKERHPSWAAEAQAMFDCWAEQQEENFQSEDINACRADFYAAMRHLKPAEVVKTAPAIEHLKIEASVYFDLDSSKLSDLAKTELQVVADKIKKVQPESIVLFGHADASGTETYNDKLSAKRADAVNMYLKELGVNTDVFTIKSAGEKQLPKPTEDGVVEQANRVVNITLVK